MQRTMRAGPGTPMTFPTITVPNVATRARKAARSRRRMIPRRRLATVQGEPPLYPPDYIPGPGQWSNSNEPGEQRRRVRRRLAHPRLEPLDRRLIQRSLRRSKTRAGRRRSESTAAIFLLIGKGPRRQPATSGTTRSGLCITSSLARLVRRSANGPMERHSNAESRIRMPLLSSAWSART